MSSSFEFDRVREGERPRTWYRTERIFRNKLGWYFQTREGIDVGPYGCRFDAEVDMEMLIRRLREAPPEKALQCVHVQAVNAGALDCLIRSSTFADYVVEEGGLELLRGLG